MWDTGHDCGSLCRCFKWVLGIQHCVESISADSLRVVLRKELLSVLCRRPWRHTILQTQRSGSDPVHATRDSVSQDSSSGSHPQWTPPRLPGDGAAQWGGNAGSGERVRAGAGKNENKPLKLKFQRKSSTQLMQVGGRGSHELTHWDHNVTGGTVSDKSAHLSYTSWLNQWCTSQPYTYYRYQDMVKIKETLFVI